MNELIEKRFKAYDEYESILGKAKAENRDVSEEERSKMDECKKEFDRLDLLVREEETRSRMESVVANAPKIETRKEKDSKMEFRDIVEQMKEKRAITVNGTGATNVVAEIVKQIIQKNDLLRKYRYFYGANASTVVPILSPGLAIPAGQSEGVTSVSADTTAVLSAKTIQPKAYVSLLPVSAEALLMSGGNLEAQLPGIFADAFAQAMYNGSINGDGSGNNMTGMFDSGALTGVVDATAAGVPTLADLVKLALTVQDYQGDYVIVINPTFIAGMLAETTAESSPIKNEIMINRSCLGVPVVITGQAPTDTTENYPLAVAMPMTNYGIAIANEMVIDPIKVKGDTNTYFQATMFFNGTTIVPANGYRLEAHAV